MKTLSMNPANLPLRKSLLIVAMWACFATAARMPRGDDHPGPLATVVLGILLLRRGAAARAQPMPVILAGCLLAVLTIMADLGSLNGNTALWIVLILIGFAFYGFWEKIEKLWRNNQGQRN